VPELGHRPIVMPMPIEMKAVAHSRDTPPCRDEAAPRMGHPIQAFMLTDSWAFSALASRAARLALLRLLRSFMKLTASV